MLAAGLAACLPRPAAAASGLAEVLAPDASPRVVYEGGRWCEGPVWAPGLGGLIFSDVRADRMLRLGPEGPAAVFRAPSNNANGNALDAQGRLLTCEHRTGRVVRAEPDGGFTVLVERYEGGRLNSPNDLVFARDGALWFTDPTYGIEQPEEGVVRPSEQPGRFVFRLDADGRLDAVERGFRQPNGLAFSPDGRTLYVAESSRHAPAIHAFPVEGTHLGPGRVFAGIDAGVPDGLKTDADGRVYAGCGDGVRVWSPSGAPLGLIPTPGPCANLAFGGPEGRTLYLCAGKRVLVVEARVRGS